MSLTPDYASDTEVISGDTPELVEVPPVRYNQIALIIDNVVADVVTCDDRFAALLLSSPKILDMTSVLEDGKNIIGWAYNPENNTVTEPGA